MCAPGRRRAYGRNRREPLVCYRLKALYVSHAYGWELSTSSGSYGRDAELMKIHKLQLWLRIFKLIFNSVQVKIDLMFTCHFKVFLLYFMGSMCIRFALAMSNNKAGFIADRARRTRFVMQVCHRLFVFCHAELSQLTADRARLYR